jgi:hypothetical protein
MAGTSSGVAMRKVGSTARQSNGWFRAEHPVTHLRGTVSPPVTLRSASSTPATGSRRAGQAPRVRCLGAIAAACLACGPQASGPIPAPSGGPATAEATPASTAATVIVSIHADGARIVYELPEASARVVLVQSDAVRRDEWRIIGAGMRLEGGAIVSDAARTSFELVIPPDSIEVDRVYPSLHRVGGGIAIFGPALLVQGVETRIVLRAGAGEVAIPETGAELGYAWLGPAAAVTQGQGFRLVADDSVAPWLVEHVRREAEVALDYYGRKLERPGRAPTILVSMQRTMEGDYRGDASKTDVISLRFFDPRWSEPDPAAAASLATFVRHEAFHLWNAGGASGAPAWLHEGGAELAAIVASVDAGALTHDQGIEQVSWHLERCRAALGNRPLVGADLSGAQIYACGVALHWVADTEARTSQRDTFAIWRELLQRGENDGYTLEDLRAVTGPAVALMLDGEGPDRWVALASALSQHGATITDAGDDRGFTVVTAPPLAP